MGRKRWQSDRQGRSTAGQQGFSSPHLQRTPGGSHMKHLLRSFTATRWKCCLWSEGVPCCCRGILEHEHAGGHSKTSHRQTLGVTPKGDSPHVQLPCDSFICPSSKASMVMTRMLACTGPASILMSPCLLCTGLRCFPLQHTERGASVSNNKGCSTSKVSSPKQHHNHINHFCFP